MTQKKFSTKKVAVLFTILLLPSFFYLILYSADHNYNPLPFIGPKEVVKIEKNGELVEDTMYHQIPPFQFTNQEGKLVTEKDFRGRVYVADFFFATCPSICPKMAAHLLQIQEKFKERDDFLILSHTVNPEHDTPEVLAEYAELVNANNKIWHFVTGKKEDIYDIAFKGYFANAQKDEIAPGGFLHSELLFLIDKEGHIRALFDGTSTSEMKKLIDAIDVLYLEDYVSMKEDKNGK